MKTPRRTKGIVALLIVFTLVMVLFPLQADAAGEEIEIVLSTLPSSASGPGWSYANKLLVLASDDPATVFHLKNSSPAQGLRIRLKGVDWYENPFQGTIILENVNIGNPASPFDFVNGSAATIKLIGNNILRSDHHAGININQGSLIIQAYDDTFSTLTAIAGGKANGIGTGEDRGNPEFPNSEKPHVTITGNCTVITQGTSQGNALGAQSLTMSGGAKLVLNNENPAKGVYPNMAKNLSNCTISGTAAGNLPLSSAALDFGSFAYSLQPQPQEVTLTYWGDAELTLTRPALEHYDIGTLSQNVLTNADTVRFTVQPKESLVPGSYNAVLPLTGSTEDGRTMATFVNLAYEVQKADQDDLHITAVPAPLIYGNPDFSLSTTGGNGDGAVTYAVLSGDAVSVNGSTVTVEKAGTAVIQAWKAADSRYNETEATLTLNVARAMPTIQNNPGVNGANVGESLSSISLPILTAYGLGGTPLAGSFAWENPQTVLQGAGSHAVIFTPVDDNYESVSCDVRVNLDTTKPTIVSLRAVPSLNRASLAVDAAADTPLTYQWQVKGSWIDIPGATSATSDYTGLSADTEYTVRVIVTDANGNRTVSDPVTFKTQKQTASLILQDTSPQDSSLPQTGDNGRIGLWLLLLLAAGVAGVVIWLKKSRSAR